MEWWDEQSRWGRIVVHARTIAGMFMLGAAVALLAIKASQGFTPDDTGFIIINIVLIVGGSIAIYKDPRLRR